MTTQESETPMKILTRIADEIYHTRRVWRGHHRIAESQAQFDRATEPVNKAVFAERIAFRIETLADHLAVSWLARATTFLPAPDQIRKLAAEWKRRAEGLYVEAARVAKER